MATSDKSLLEDLLVSERLETDSGQTEVNAPLDELAKPSPEACPEVEQEGRLCDTFLERFSSMMNHQHVSTVLEEQAHMLSAFEVANEKLSSLNRISAFNYYNMSVEIKQTTRTLAVMKKELDSVFRRIRSLKSQVASQYPEAYAKALREQQQELSEDTLEED